MATFFPYVLFFFFNDTATTEIYTLSLHDALPIFPTLRCCGIPRLQALHHNGKDRKSTRLNSSHGSISYAVFCLKKKNINMCSKVSLSRECYLVCVRDESCAL